MKRFSARMACLGAFSISRAGTEENGFLVDRPERRMTMTQRIWIRVAAVATVLAGAAGLAGFGMPGAPIDAALTAGDEDGSSAGTAAFSSGGEAWISGLSAAFERHGSLAAAGGSTTFLRMLTQGSGPSGRDGGEGGADRLAQADEGGGHEGGADRLAQADEGGAHEGGADRLAQADEGGGHEGGADRIASLGKPMPLAG